MTLAACYQTEQTKEIENIYRDVSLSNKTQFKKGIGLINNNHVKNLEAEMLDEVFCYSPRLGGGAYFFIPTARMQNFGYVDLQPSDVVGGGGGGSPADLLMAQLSGPVPMVTIKDVHNPCLRATLEMVLHNTKILNEMSQLLQNFGFSTNIKITFEESNLSSNISNNSADLGQFKPRFKNSYRIVLDNYKLPNYSREVIVSVIYHELLHAQLEYKFHETESQDHERMATEYLAFAVKALRNQFSYMDEFTAKALVFAGLKNTNLYKYNVRQLDFSEKLLMEDIEKDYKMNRKNGSYCN
ncbi:hypothetical protein VR610_10685 [Aquirufa regiilacus]